MRRLAPLAPLAFVAVLLMAADIPNGKTATSGQVVSGVNASGQATQFVLTDGGAVQTSPIGPGPLDLQYASQYVYTDCASGGSTRADGGVSIPAGNYLLMVTDEKTNVCYAATCASGGYPFIAPMPYAIHFSAATNVSCNSTSNTGDLSYVLLSP